VARCVLAVDIGGTKILTAVVAADGRVLARHRLDTPPRGVEPVLAAVEAGARAALRGAGLALRDVTAAGVGAPGPLDPRAGIVFEPPNLPGWRNVPLADLLRGRLGLPVFVENDANAAAVGEWWVGAGRGAHDLIYLTVSTGIGGGIIIGDRLLQGASGTAGEVGHMTIDVDGPPCPCGRSTGCLEVLASGTAIARMAREALALPRPTALRGFAGGDPAAIEARHVAEAAQAGDAVAAEIFERAATYLGVGVANLLNLCNPQRIVIGGGVSKAGALLFEPVRRVATARAFERPGRDAQILPAALGDDVGVVGAAAVALQRSGRGLR
jgi:glucokinase